MAKTWFITGCSSGFGSQFVHQLRAAGHNVIATGRDAKKKLAFLESTGATIMELDVTDPFVDIQSKLQEAWEIYPGGIDIVVNNAGFVMGGVTEKVSWATVSQEDIERVMRTNFYGPLNITRAILPNLRAKGSGTLVFISSINGWVGGVSSTPYVSSKFALEGMVECLSKELAAVAPGIRVFMPEPGLFRTPVLNKGTYIRSGLDAYTQLDAETENAVKSVDGNQRGDPVKGVKHLIDLIQDASIAGGRNLPLRMPIGADAFDIIKQKCEDMLAIVEDWKHTGHVTDFS